MQQRAAYRGRGDLRADRLDVAHLLQMPLLHRAPRRDVDAAAALQLVHVIGELAAITREADRIERRERIHEGDEIGGAKRTEHEARELLPRPQGRNELSDVILVPEQQEDTHIVSRGFGGGVFPGSNGKREIVGRLSVDFEELERGDGLRNSILLHFEVFGREVLDRLTVSIRDVHVDANEIGPGSEGGCCGAGSCAATATAQTARNRAIRNRMAVSPDRTTPQGRDGQISVGDS